MRRRVYKTADEFFEQNKSLCTNIEYSENIDILKTELIIQENVIHNRLVCQPMEGCDGTIDGKPGELTNRRYMRLASGSAGLIWFEATAVMNEGKANKRQLYINEKTLDSFKATVELIKETSMRENGYEPIVILQATHSGRYSKPEGKPAPLIAYNNPIFEKNNPITKTSIVTDEYLDRVGEALIKGAALAESAGFDGVDIKCCHRYLNSELLSAYNREGRYGGNLENRTRLLRESVDGVINSCSSRFIVTSRLNAYDGFAHPYGFGVKDNGSLEFYAKEPAWLIGKLYESGVRLINITMGNPYFNPHVNRPFSVGGYEAPEHPLVGTARIISVISELKKQVPKMSFVSSAMTYLGSVSPNVASAYIEKDLFDLAGFGRMTLAYPDFARDIINKGALDSKKCCTCCSKCSEIMRSGSTPGCVIHDKDIYLKIYRELFGK
ncbi:MAG: flavin oxidoreductase/NADH oxidase [Clostridiales bacterium]|nr:flavin oxidoreductase/NADH oxidase [Clostridiales bacterium]